MCQKSLVAIIIASFGFAIVLSVFLGYYGPEGPSFLQKKVKK